MTRRRNLIPLNGTDAQDNAALDTDETEDSLLLSEEVQEYTPQYQEDDWSEEEQEMGTGPVLAWLAPALATLLIAVWTGFFGWTYGESMLAGAPPAQWVEWIASWSMPVLLVIGFWLLVMRTSRRETARFNDAARSLAQESAALESRLQVVNRELSLARDFIASQSRDLEALGRVASERLSMNADRLQSLIHDNSAQIDSIGSVSTSALTNMEQLRDQLPVIGNAARDVSNQIGNAGNVAHAQIEQLVAGFDRLNQFGEVGEQHVDQVSEKVTAALDNFDRQVAALGEVTQARFRKLRDVSENFRTSLDEAEEQALSAIKTRTEAMVAEIDAQTATQRETEDAAIAAMRERITMLKSEGNELLGKFDEGSRESTATWNRAIEALEERMKQAVSTIVQVDKHAMDSARKRLSELVEEAARADESVATSLAAFEGDLERRRTRHKEREAEELAALENRIGVFDQQLAERQERHTAHVASLADRADALAARLTSIDGDIQRIVSLGSETHEGIGDAADKLAERLSQSRAILEENGGFVEKLTNDSVRLLELIRSSADHSQGALSDAVGNAEARLTNFGAEAQRLHELMDQAGERSEALSAKLGEARERGSASLADLEAMEVRLAQVAQESERLAEQTGSELRAAIETLANSSGEALESLRGNYAEVINEIAARIAEDSRARIAGAIRADAAEVIGELEAAVARAAESGQGTTATLRDQLTRVDELARNLEARIAHARERAEERVDSDLSRRMALITEALNSSAIDIAKAFDNEVSDTQWAHYLRGDRGIFTRRAVRLLDRSESRAVLDFYGEDAEFRETVNRYIHDFEAMLREVLATRDGNAMAVTLLSSDMGKLYVALAQSIERLRQ